MKSLAMHITNQKLLIHMHVLIHMLIYSRKFTKYVHGTWFLLNILMIFGIKKINNFDPYNVLLAIATNLPVQHMTGFVVQGHTSTYTSSKPAWYAWFDQDGRELSEIESLICFLLYSSVLRDSRCSSIHNDLWLMNPLDTSAAPSPGPLSHGDRLRTSDWSLAAVSWGNSTGRMAGVLRVLFGGELLDWFCYHKGWG